MLPFLSQELGRTVTDAPDVWAFLRTSYIKANNYASKDYRGRVQSDLEKAEGIETKSFERWLYQRDAPGYETQPVIKIQQAIEMWMVQPDKYYDYIARAGKKIGFDIDDRWHNSKDKVAIKVTYFDNHAGELKFKYNGGDAFRSLTLSGDNKLKTATFFIDGIRANSMDRGFDFTLEADDSTEQIVVSMVRVIDSKK
jgi:hypothetical protein